MPAWGSADENDEEQRDVSVCAGGRAEDEEELEDKKNVCVRAC
jgi:hypothetical protein